LRDERELWLSGHRVIRGEKGRKIGGAAVGQSLILLVPHTPLARGIHLRKISPLFVMHPVHSELHATKATAVKMSNLPNYRRRNSERRKKILR
jgi:hypothetical protein